MKNTSSLKSSLQSTFKPGSDGPTQLGELLLRAGLVTEAQLAASTKASSSMPSRLGQFLVMSGYVSHKELENALQVQCLIREKMLERQIGINALRLTRHKNLTLKDALSLLEYPETEGQPSSRLGDLLVEAKVVTREELEDALTCNQSSGLPLGRVLILSTIISEQTLEAALNAQMVLRKGAIERHDAVRAIANAHQKACMTATSSLTSFACDSADASAPMVDRAPIVLPAPVSEPSPPETPVESQVEDIGSKRDLFFERLLVQAQIISESELQGAVQAAAEQGRSLEDQIVSMGLEEHATLNMVREMQQLVIDKFVDENFCIQLVREAYDERRVRESVPSAPPAVVDKTSESANSSHAEQAPKSFALPEFLLLCNVISKEALTQDTSSSEGGELSAAAYLSGADVDSRVIDLAEQCFKLAKAQSISLDQAVFSFDFCSRQMAEKRMPLFDAAEMLGFQMGIWALHDVLAAW